MTEESTAEDFPVGARVTLHSLKSASQHNGKVGIIRSSLNQSGRQHVQVEELDLALKPGNLKYEPRSVDSLSTKQLKAVLKQLDPTADGDRLNGMEKMELRGLVSQNTTSPEQISKLLAHSTTASPLQPPKIDKEQLNKQVSAMENMSADQWKQQAAMMRSNPAMVRSMSPQMAHMTDDQIRQAASQMDLMATNPQMRKMATERAKNMSATDFEQFQGASGSIPTTAAPAAPPNAATLKEQALDNMNPERLKQQAAMMRSLSPDQIRQMNPAMASFSDAQIKMAADQMESLAENPEMMKMTTDQMKNMSKEDLENIQKMQSGNGISPAAGIGPGAGAAPGGGMGMMGMDPSKMDPKQLKEMVKLLKKNPGMVKQVLGSNPSMANVTEEQLEKQLDMFANMDEAQMEKAVLWMGRVQKVAAPVKNLWDKLNAMVGGKLWSIVRFLLMLCLVLVLKMVVRRMNGGGSGGGKIMDDLVAEAAAKTEEAIDLDEFGGEF